MAMWMTSSPTFHGRRPRRTMSAARPITGGAARPARTFGSICGVPPASRPPLSPCWRPVTAATMATADIAASRAVSTVVAGAELTTTAIVAATSTIRTVRTTAVDAAPAANAPSSETSTIPASRQRLRTPIDPRAGARIMSSSPAPKEMTPKTALPITTGSMPPA